jgi:hypothetical protein
MSGGAESSNVRFAGDVLAREVRFCFDAINKVKGNESSWNYLNGSVAGDIL